MKCYQVLQKTFKTKKREVQIMDKQIIGRFYIVYYHPSYKWAVSCCGIIKDGFQTKEDALLWVISELSKYVVFPED